MFCIHCGAECPDQAQFCASCGQKLASNNKAEIKETPENASVKQRKVKTVKKGMLFGAITLIALSVVVIALSMIFLKKNDGSVEESQRTDFPNNMFSTIADLSEINLYLTKTYGQNVPQKCNYYEFFAADNHYILVEVKNVPGLETEGEGMPKYELFCYPDPGNHIPLFECQHDYMKTATTVNSEKENASIYKLTFGGTGAIAELYSQYLGSEYELEKMYIGIVDGKLEKIVFNNGFSDNSTLIHYHYNRDGFVSSLVMDDCTNNKLDDEFDVNSIIWEEGDEPLGAIEFRYNKDGTLAESSLNSWGEEEYYNHCQFEYENGVRSCITIDDNSDVKRIEYTRDEHGLVKTADVTSNDSNQQFLVDYYNYYDQDTLTISEKFDPYSVSDTGEISASELKFISAQDLKESNGGSAIEDGMENVVYDMEDVLLDGTYIISAVAQIRQRLANSTNEFTLSVKFNDEGTKIFQETTRNLMDQQLCILYGNKVISSPIVHSEIAYGEAVISGFQSLQEVEKLAATLSK